MESYRVGKAPTTGGDAFRRGEDDCRLSSSLYRVSFCTYSQSIRTGRLFLSFVLVLVVCHYDCISSSE